VKPDGIILGKALGGGLMPVSAFCARESVMGVFKPATMAAPSAATRWARPSASNRERLLDEKLSERAAVMGEYLLKRLKAISSPMIVDIRGKGLLIGLEIEPSALPRGNSSRRSSSTAC